MMNNKKEINPFDYHEKYRLPVMITKKDIEMEKIYLNYHNDAYWEEYKKKKLDEYNDKTGTV